MKERNHNIVTAAKKWRPFDYGFTIDMLILQLREMLKFYTDGKGVVQADESCDQVKAQLTKALQLYEEAADFENDDFIRLDAFCAEQGLVWPEIPAAPMRNQLKKSPLRYYSKSLLTSVSGGTERIL